MCIPFVSFVLSCLYIYQYSLLFSTLNDFSAPLPGGTREILLLVHLAGPDLWLHRADLEVGEVVMLMMSSVVCLVIAHETDCVVD